MEQNLEFITIEKLEEIKSEYTMKALNEYQKIGKVNTRTDQILWYASRAILKYNEFGKTTNMTKVIKDYYLTIGELELMLKGNWKKDEEA